MDNPEILFYIVFGLIYFLTRKKKKKKIIQPPPKNVALPSKGNDEELPPLSFQELLKELTGQGKPGNQPKSEPEEVIEVSVPDELIEPDEPNVESDRVHKGVDWTKNYMDETLTSTFDDEAIKQRYEEATSLQSMETSGDIKEKDTSSQRFGVYKIQEKHFVADKIKEMLSDPDDIKNAVILSEVLKRKF